MADHEEEPDVGSQSIVPQPPKAPRVADWEVPEYRPTLQQLRWDDEVTGCLLGLFMVAALGLVLLAIVRASFGQGSSWDDLEVGFSLVLGSVFVTVICAALAGGLAPVLHSKGWRKTARGLRLSSLIAIALPFVSCGGCFMWFGSKF